MSFADRTTETVNLQVVYAIDGHHDCFTYERMTLYILQPVYAFLQLFMIYKFSNVRY